MTTRRGFLGAILAAAAAPAIIKAEALMPVRKIVAPPTTIWKPKPYITDDPDQWLHIGKMHTVNLQQAMLRTGDLFTIVGVNSTFGAPQQFRVTAVASGSSVVTVEAF